MEVMAAKPLQKTGRIKSIYKNKEKEDKTKEAFFLFVLSVKQQSNVHKPTG